MQDIHDILPLIWPPNYTNYFIFFWIILLFLILFFLKKFFSPKKNLEIEKKFFYSKEKFLEDFYKIKNFVEKKSEEEFREIYWKELSKILKTFISYNHDKKIFFLSLWEIINRKKIKHLEKIFQKFDEQFYFYEKKWKEEFLELVWEIEREFK